MAVKLNRTIIAPPFFKHSRNDVTAAEEGDEVVPSYLRLGKFSFLYKITVDRIKPPVYKYFLVLVLLIQMSQNCASL